MRLKVSRLYNALKYWEQLAETSQKFSLFQFRKMRRRVEFSENSYQFEWNFIR